MDKRKNETDDFLIGLTPGSDGDILHLSEGINGEIGCNILKYSLEDEENDKE